MGTGHSIETKRDIVPAPRFSNRNQVRQESHPALILAEQTRDMPRHEEFRRTQTHRGKLTTTRSKEIKSETVAPALPCSLTRRLVSRKSERPMPIITFGEVNVKHSSDYPVGHKDRDFFDRNTYVIPVNGRPEPRLLRLLREVIGAVMRFNTTRSFRVYDDSTFPYSMVMKTSGRLRWKKFVQPCLDDALRAFQALELFGLTRSQFEKLVNGLGNRKNPNLLAQLLKPVERRIGFVHDEKLNVAVELYDTTKPDDALVNNLIAWVFELRKIGAYEAIFALLDRLDLSMVGEFRDFSEEDLPRWQKDVVECYRHLTGASLRELAERHWINFNDLIADLKTELIIGLCDPASGYYDPVMAAKVMLRQARANPYSGELATGDIVIEALIAAGIPPKLLAQAIGRRKGSSEAHWWGKFEHRREDLDGEVDRAEPPRLGTSEDALPRFSLHRIVGRNYQREIRLHNVAPKSPVKRVIGYILQGLVEAIYPGRPTEVRTYEREEKVLISFGGDNVLKASVMGARCAESMFRSFANYGIPEEMVAEFFAGHSEKGTKNLFSEGIAKLLAMPDRSGFGIVRFPDHFEVRAKHLESDQQRLDRAKHLSETIIDLARLGQTDAANTLLPLLVSDLKELWDETDRKPLDWDKLKFSELHGKLEILLESQREAAVLQEDDELVLQQSEEPTPEVDPVWRRV